MTPLTSIWTVAVKVSSREPPDGVTSSENRIGPADAAADAPAIVRRLVEAGAAVQTVGAEEPPLEEVYLRLLGAEGEA